MIFGNFGDCFFIINKCINLEPKEHEHRTELNHIQKTIRDFESIEELIKKKEFVKAEEISEKLLKECLEFNALKITYIKVLIENLKLVEAIKFIISKISQEEKNDEIEYFLALAFYYDGQ